MKHGGLSRADLICCYERMDESRFLRVAENLGYREENLTAGKKTEAAMEDANEAIVVEHESPVRVAAEAPLPQRQYRLTEHRVLALLPASPNTPPFEAEAGVEEELPPPLGPPPPLMPWARLWPFLRAALGESKERGRIDLPALVADIGRGRTLRRLPRLACRRWAPQGQLILDLSQRLYPFWDDFHAIKAQLLKLRGGAGLEVWRLDQGPAGLARRWERGGWSEPRPYFPPSAGVPVLVASDLGCLGEAEDRQAWLRLGRRLAALSIVPTALTPCPPRGWQPELAGLFFPVVLDRTAHLPPAPRGPRPWPTQAPSADWWARDAAAQYLLALLSPCIGIGPALLRHLRHALPAALADVGSEAAAWRHPAFRAGDFALLPGEAKGIAALRERCSRLEPGQRELTWRLIRAQQHEVSQAVRMEERALYAAMAGRSDPAAEQFTDRVAAALEQTEQSEQARFLIAWVNRRARRTHPPAWFYSPRMEVLWLRANPQALQSGTELPEGLDPHRALAALGAPKQTQSWRLVQRGMALEVEAISVPTPSPALGKRGGEAEITGSPLFDFTTRRPLLWVRENRPDALPASLPLAGGTSLPLKEAGYRLQSDNETWLIEPVECPSWAHTLGRDSDGLYVDFNDGREERRAYWLNPGPQPVWQAGGRAIGMVTLSNGAFVDQQQFRWLRQGGLRRPGWAKSFGVDDAGIFTVLRVKQVEQRFRWVWPGRFLMGSPKEEYAREGDEYQHEVTLTRGFWLAETACTQALWRAVAGKNPGRFPGEQRPVERVSWDDTNGFIVRLNYLVKGLSARLPTEAEWEYACRAGTQAPFSFGDDITPEQVNYDGNYPYRGSKMGLHRGLYRKETVEVACLPANAWGLHEMHGNVWEWCQDWYGDYAKSPIADPAGLAISMKRVLRGGSWLGISCRMRSACRNFGGPGYRDGTIGFRLALSPEL